GRGENECRPLSTAPSVTMKDESRFSDAGGALDDDGTTADGRGGGAGGGAAARAAGGGADRGGSRPDGAPAPGVPPRHRRPGGVPGRLARLGRRSEGAARRLRPGLPRALRPA